MNYNINWCNIGPFVSLSLQPHYVEPSHSETWSSGGEYTWLKKDTDHGNPSSLKVSSLPKIRHSYCVVLIISTVLRNP